MNNLLDVYFKLKNFILMIKSAANYSSNSRDKVVISLVHSKNKENELEIMKNKKSKTDFCYSYGIYIFMVALLSALIAVNFVLYLHVNKYSENLEDDLATLKSEISKLKKRVNEITFAMGSNFEIITSKISTSVNELKRVTHFNVKAVRNEISSLSKKLNDFIISLYVVNIQNNVQVSQYIEGGFSIVYDKPYSHVTSISEIDEIQKSCLPTSMLCLGGRNSTNVFLVVACGYCSVILSKTPKNTPNLHNGIYWYYSPDVENSQSMGFAPNSTINQANADVFDESNDERVSWQLNGKSGGWRLGSLIKLDNSSNYYKVILKKDADA
jgi:hypothetical protein